MCPGARTFERTFPGDPAIGQLLRALLARFLQPCPVADDVTALTWELAANAITHSDSGLPGGQFTVTMHDFPGDYVYADVCDQGSRWAAGGQPTWTQPRNGRTACTCSTS